MCLGTPPSEGASFFCAPFSTSKTDICLLRAAFRGSISKCALIRAAFGCTKVGAYRIRPPDVPSMERITLKMDAFCAFIILGMSSGGAYAIRPYPDGRKIIAPQPCYLVGGAKRAAFGTCYLVGSAKRAAFGTCILGGSAKRAAFGTSILVGGEKRAAFGTSILVGSEKRAAFGTSILGGGEKRAAFESSI